MTKRPYEIACSKLSEIASDADIPLSHRAIALKEHCPLDAAYAALFSSGDASTLIVGASECSYYTRMGTPNNFEEGVLHWTYTLEEADIVFGCEKGLTEAIVKMHGRGIRRLAVLATCVPNVIADDIEAVVRKMREDLDMSILYVSLPHFMTKSPSAGLVEYYKATTTLMEPAAHKHDVINVLGTVSGDEFSVVSNLLEQAGFKVNRLGADTRLMDFVNAPEAKLNLLYSMSMLQMAEAMRERFDIDFIDFTRASRCEDLDTPYQKLARLTGAPLSKALQPFREKLQANMNAFKHLEREKTYIFLEKEDDTLAHVVMLSTLGFIPKLLHVEVYRDRDGATRKVLLDSGIDPDVCYDVGGDPEHLVDLYDVDMVIGGDASETLKRPQVRYPQERFVGYEKQTKRLEAIRETLEGETDGT